MNYYALIGLFNGIVVLFAAARILFKNVRLDFYRSFLTFSLSVGLWSIFYAVWQIQTTHDAALFWMRIAMLMIYPSSFGFLWFVMDICGIQKNKLQKYFLISVPVFFMFFTFSPLMVKDVESRLMFPFWPVPGPLMCLYTFIFCSCVIVSFALLITTYFRAIEQHRWQLKWVIFTMAPAWFGGSTNWLLWYGIEFPPLPNFFVGVGWLLLAYAMIRVRLFDVDVLADYIQEARLSAIGLLTASIHHEIKSPIFVIRGLAENLAEKTKQTNLSNQGVLQNEVKLACEKITQQTERVTEIIRKFRDFANRPKGQLLKMQNIFVKDALDNVMPLIQSQIEAHKIQLDVSIPDDLKIFADIYSVEEILLNLLLNACQALKNTQEPRIKLSASVFEDQRPTTNDQRISQHAKRAVHGPSSISIVIEDNGPGISPEQIKHIFKPFHTTKSEGTGLGLYITKQLVEKCGGAIKVESGNRGAKFIVNFKGA